MKGWLKREERRGLAVGQLWYLISMDWWRNWNDFVSNTARVKLKHHIMYYLICVFIIK